MTSIGLFTYSTKPRGSVVHACYLAEALTARGHDVTLYALSKAGDRMYRELSCPVVYFQAGPAPDDPDALIEQRIGEVARGVAAFASRHDVYHAEDCLVASGLLSPGTTRDFRPLVRTLHHLERFESRYLQECQRRSILEADAVVCVSELGRGDVQREFGRSCPIIGNGVDAARFAPDEELLQWAQVRFGVGAGQVVVLSVGGVEPRKNSLRCLQAMARVLRMHPALIWFIAGGASIWEHEEYRAEFRREWASLEPSVQARIVELGAVGERELTGLFQMSRILLCPSLQEGFGLCVLEALASNTVAVVSHQAPFTEYLPETCACFVNPESTVSIAEAVERLWGDAELCARLTRNGTQRARLFSWDKVAEQHERLYRHVLERPSDPSSIPREELAHA